MAQRPRINLEATYFLDSYKSEVEVIKLKKILMKEIVNDQFKREDSLNKEIRDFQELKLRKIQDHIY